jgi:hypothetical protein
MQHPAGVSFIIIRCGTSPDHINALAKKLHACPHSFLPPKIFTLGRDNLLSFC